MLSIIIPTLNEEDYLPLVLESIQKQTFKDCEVIIADAGSKDATLEIARKYGCKIVAGGLPAKGRNNGAKVAKGDVLLFLDADVILPPSFLKNAMGEFKQRGLGIAGFKVLPLHGRKIDVLTFYLYNTWVALNQRILPYAATAIMSDKKNHHDIGGFDEEIKLFEDISYTRKMAKVAKYGYIDEPFFTSVRRYQKDGRLMNVTYFLAGLYVNFLGPIKSDIFNYKFGHYKDEKK